MQLTLSLNKETVTSKYESSLLSPLATLGSIKASSSKHPGSKFELLSLSGLLKVWGKQLACEDPTSVRRQGD